MPHDLIWQSQVINHWAAIVENSKLFVLAKRYTQPRLLPFDLVGYTTASSGRIPAPAVATDYQGNRPRVKDRGRLLCQDNPN